jgi:hypothetical protein
MSKDGKRKNGLSSWCKECRQVSGRLWRSKQDSEELKRNAKERYHKAFNSEKARDYSLRYRYGISQQEYDILLKNQNDTCAICKRDAKQMTYFLHTDHNHITGEVRGLLCAPCNVYLGYIRDSITTLKNAMDYLGEKC